MKNLCRVVLALLTATHVFLAPAVRADCSNGVFPYTYQQGRTVVRGVWGMDIIDHGVVEDHSTYTRHAIEVCIEMVEKGERVCRHGTGVGTRNRLKGGALSGWTALSFDLETASGVYSHSVEIVGGIGWGRYRGPDCPTEGCEFGVALFN